jgi:hypothetical protein
MMDDDLKRRIRERAYEIWEREGRSGGPVANSWRLPLVEDAGRMCASDTPLQAGELM